MSSTSLQCPSCGRQDIDVDKQCVCGFNADGSFMAEVEKKGSGTTKKSKTLKNIDEPTNNQNPNNQVIKEIDSWKFSFSPPTSISNNLFFWPLAVQQKNVSFRQNSIRINPPNSG